MIIKDPASGEFYRLGETERFIAEQLDGATSVEVIQGRAEERFGAPLAPDALTGFIKTLDRNGLLESEQRARKRRRGRIAGSPLYLRFRLLDPDRLLGRLVHCLRFFFTRRFLFLSATLIVMAAVVTVLNWEEFVQDASQLYRVSTLPLLVATIFAVVTAHEFAHGLTCKHFGGGVREMGFLLLYFQPALYCNVSDAWLFPEKAKRLWVGFAGPYFELFIWALATLVWRVTDPETWLSHVSLIVMATSGIKTLFNFNPLLKLDGYYLLSDYLDIPNLRKKSFRYLGGFLKRLGGLTGRLTETSPREKRIYLTYGLTASVGSFVFLAYAALTVGGFLIEQDHRAAFVAFAGLIVTRLRSKWRRLFGRDAESSRPLKRAWASLQKLTLKLAGLAILLGILFFGRMELRIAGPSSVLPFHNADVRTEIEGIIEQIFVDEGAKVRKGDLIARLSDRDYRAALQKIGAEIQETQARIELLVAGPSTKEQIELVRTIIAGAEAKLKFAQTRLARDKSLFEQQLISRNDFDATQEQAATAEGEVLEVKKRLQILLEGSRPEEIKAARSELARLEAQQRYVEEQLQLVNVLSPATGVITTPSRQLKEMVRQMKQKGDLIAKVHELDTVTVEASISEKEIADVKVGQTVGIKARAYPDRIFYGKVTAIATATQGATATDSSGKSATSSNPPGGASKPGSTILVTTEIDNSAGFLKPGMTGMTKIYCGNRRIIDLVIRRLSRTFRVEFWSWW